MPHDREPELVWTMREPEVQPTIEKSRVSRLEEVLLNSLGTLLIVFCYAFAREGWGDGYYHSLHGHAKDLFLGIMSTLMVIGAASIPTQLRIKRSSGGLRYRKYPRLVVGVSVLLIVAFEWLVVP